MGVPLLLLEVAAEQVPNHDHPVQVSRSQYFSLPCQAGGMVELGLQWRRERERERERKREREGAREREAGG